VLHTTPQSVINAVRAIPLFSACNAKELREVARLGTTTTIQAGKTITKEGTVGRELLVVLSGKATCRVKGKRLASFGPGDFFGEMSLLDSGLRSATVVADSDMELLVLTTREFRSLLETSPTIAWKLLVAMAARLRSADEYFSY